MCYDQSCYSYSITTFQNAALISARCWQVLSHHYWQVFSQHYWQLLNYFERLMLRVYCWTIKSIEICSHWILLFSNRLLTLSNCSHTPLRVLLYNIHLMRKHLYWFYCLVINSKHLGWFIMQHVNWSTIASVLEWLKTEEFLDLNPNYIILGILVSL